MTVNVNFNQQSEQLAVTLRTFNGTKDSKDLTKIQYQL